MGAIQQLCRTAIVIQDGSLAHEGASAECIDYYLQSSICNSALAVLTFSENTLRKGDGRGKYTRLRLLNSNNVETNIFRVGDKVCIELTAESHVSIRNPRFTITLQTMSGTKLSRINSAETSTLSVHLENNLTVRCCIPHLPLCPGSFKISLVLADEGRVLMDAIEDAALFFVVDGDFYGTGKHLATYDYPILLPCQWSSDTVGNAIEPNAKHANPRQSLV